MGLVDKMTAKLQGKSSEASIAAAGVVGIVGVIQLGTDWNPVGRCFTFWKQLRNHVRSDDEHQGERRGHFYIYNGEENVAVWFVFLKMLAVAFSHSLSTFLPFLCCSGKAPYLFG